MELQVGDRVVHPIYGVGRIAAVGKKRFTGEARVYYEVVAEKTTVWVPMESSDAIGLRRLTTKIDLAAYRKVLKSRPLSLTQDHTRRRTELAAGLKQGSFQALCEMVRDLTARGWHKPLGSADAAYLRRAHDHLCEEWASADGVSIAAANEEIDSLLLESRQADKKTAVGPI